MLKILCVFVALLFGFSQSKAQLISPPIAPNLGQDLNSLKSSLEFKIAKQRLLALGYSAEEIERALSELKPEEISAIASLKSRAPSGSDALSIIVVSLIIAILIVVLLRLTDREIIIR
ncbi:MAG: PA2779 family protein [Aquificaceae bacterium]